MNGSMKLSLCNFRKNDCSVVVLDGRNQVKTKEILKTKNEDLTSVYLKNLVNEKLPECLVGTKDKLLFIQGRIP